MGNNDEQPAGRRHFKGAAGLGKRGRKIKITRYKPNDYFMDLPWQELAKRVVR
jgi:hypothetical protein